MVIDVAATAPVLSAVPLARAHLPTARSLGAAVPVVANVVVEVRVTTTLVAALVVGLVSLNVTADPLTEVTDPEAAPKDPPRNPPAPVGREPEPGVNGRDPPSGGVPPPGRPPKPPVRPPNPPVHDPLTGWETDTVVAVTGPPNRLVFGVEPDVGVPKAETHDPTVTAEAVAVVICWKVVDDV